MFYYELAVVNQRLVNPVNSTAITLKLYNFQRWKKRSLSVISKKWRHALLLTGELSILTQLKISAIQNMEENRSIADSVTKYSRNEKLIKNHYLYSIEQPL